MNKNRDSRIDRIVDRSIVLGSYIFFFSLGGLLIVAGLTSYLAHDAQAWETMVCIAYGAGIAWLGTWVGRDQ